MSTLSAFSLGKLSRTTPFPAISTPGTRLLRAFGPPVLRNKLLPWDANWLRLDSARSAEFNFLATKRDSAGMPASGSEATMVDISSGAPPGSHARSTTNGSADLDRWRMVHKQYY